MATGPDASEDHVLRLNRESTQLEAEARRLMAEASKLQALRLVKMTKESWLDRLAYGLPTAFLAFILVLAIAIMGLGAVLARLFLR